MPFDMPRNLGHYNEEGLRALHAEAVAEHARVRAEAEANDRANLTRAHLDQMIALRTFCANVQTQLATFGATTTNMSDPPPPDDTPPSVVDVAAGQQQDTPNGQETDLPYLVASAGSHTSEPGERLDLVAAANLLVERIDSLAGAGSSQQVPTFAVRRPIPEGHELRGDRTDRAVLSAVSDAAIEEGFRHLAAMREDPAAEMRSLTASSGWCSVSPTDYTIRSTYARDAILDNPTVMAPRGGLNWYPELLFGTVYGGFTGTNFFNLTESQVEGGTPKTFVEVGCPDPTELRLHVAGLGVITNLLAMRAFPEYTREFISGALLGLQYYENALNIAAIVAGSVPVVLTGTNPWVADGSVFSVVLPAAEMAAEDVRASKMLARNHPIRMVFPVWVQAQIRADLARRRGMTDPWVADAWIMAKFAQINVIPRFVRNYQDAWSGAGGVGLGQATRLLALPTDLKFLVYPEGTWVRAELDVIRISTVYDVIRVAANQRMELFTETGYRMIPQLTGSYEYEVTICPTGAIGASVDNTCDEIQE